MKSLTRGLLALGAAWALCGVSPAQDQCYRLELVQKGGFEISKEDKKCSITERTQWFRIWTPWGPIRVAPTDTQYDVSCPLKKVDKPDIYECVPAEEGYYVALGNVEEYTMHFKGCQQIEDGAVCLYSVSKRKFLNCYAVALCPAPETGGVDPGTGSE